MGLSGSRMRSNLVPTSTARLVSILKFSRIWGGRKEEKEGGCGDGDAQSILPGPLQGKSKGQGRGSKGQGRGSKGCGLALRDGVGALKDGVGALRDTVWH